MRTAPGTARWTIQEGDIQAEAKLQIELGVHPAVAKLLVQRGHDTPEKADRFLNPSLDNLPDPFLLPDAEAACERIKLALADPEQRIMVHGDYDGDGVTSAALWTRVLRKLAGDDRVDVIVPHRKKSGYDMKEAAVRQAHANGVKLIVTTDCGITRYDEVELARELGMDVVITDHHQPDPAHPLPRASAVVNPHRTGSMYPFRDLAGVGVAFRLCEALAIHLGHGAGSIRKHFLDLAAIGTVTDMMPLLEDNRIIVKHGLKALRETRKPGLRALINVCGYADRPLDAACIGFGIGPRLNAVGRIDDSKAALDLLITKEEDEAVRLAEHLNDTNILRKEEMERIEGEALALVAQRDIEDLYCLVIAGENWNSGIVGLVANRLVERYHRPAVVIALDEAGEIGRGSARSINAFDLFDAIVKCSELLQTRGGHAHAAGFSMEAKHIPDFQAQMERIARDSLTESDLQPELEVSAEIEVDTICPDLLNQVEALAPFGSDNAEPLFVSRSARIQETRLLSEGKHLKIQIEAPGVNANNLLPALFWNQGRFAEALKAGDTLDICYRLQFNEFRGSRSIQAVVADIRPPE